GAGRRPTVQTVESPPLRQAHLTSGCLDARGMQGDPRGMTSPAEVESRHTLRTAVGRYEELRSREVLDGLAADDVLELLALSEVIARKGGYGRQHAVLQCACGG